MKLFAIRIENGETTLVSGANREEALQNAGLTAEVLEGLRTSAQGHKWDHADLTETGLGPQRYELIEFDEFLITLKLDEDGDFQISDYSPKTIGDLSTL